MGVGLVAPRPLEVEDEILFVPRAAWLTRKTAHTDHRPILDDPQVRSVFSHGMSRLALLVALERETPGSFFGPYLEELAEPTVPYVLTDEERAAIQGLPLGRWIDEQFALTEKECAALRRRLEEGYPDLAPIRRLTPGRWRWAYGHVMQRTFTVDVEDEEVWVLVPGMDLCNHADEPNAQFFAEEDGWYLEASRPIREGEQITIRYGRAKTSSDLLLYYGFVTPHNPNDRLHLQLELSADDPDRTAKREAVEVLGLATDALIGADAAVPSSFLHAVILWGLESRVFREDQPEVATPERAIQALERVAAAIEISLAGFPTTLEEDLGTLEDARPEGWLPALITYRANVKRLHRDVLTSIRKRIDAIVADGWRPEDVVEDDPDGRHGLTTVHVPA
ncbi:MAG: SET domain-containing histone-lysine N-methyltransferase [Planctomycetota bacterium]